MQFEVHSDLILRVALNFDAFVDIEVTVGGGAGSARSAGERLGRGLRGGKRV